MSDTTPTHNPEASDPDVELIVPGHGAEGRLSLEEFEALPFRERMKRSNEHPLSRGEDWNPDIEVRRIHSLMERGLMVALELGDRLRLAKSMLGHGRFEEWVEKNLPISTRTARENMLLSKRMEAHPDLRKPMARVGLSKARALLSLPKEDLEELSSSGSVGGMSIEEIEGESYRLVVKRLRKREQEIEERDRQVERERKARQEAEERLNKHLRTVGAIESAESAELVTAVKESEKRVVDELRVFLMLAERACTSKVLDGFGRREIVATAAKLKNDVEAVLLTIEGTAGADIPGHVWHDILSRTTVRPVDGDFVPLGYERQTSQGDGGDADSGDVADVLARIEHMGTDELEELIRAEQFSSGREPRPEVVQAAYRRQLALTAGGEG